jgi:uncharacterized membrane protein YhaH (DUF805 family)
LNYFEAIGSGFRNYVGFSSRASRSEYWYWTLFAVLVSIAAVAGDAALMGAQAGEISPLSTIASLALLLPGLAVSVRRLHDLDRTGWWLLINLTIVGAFVVLVWFCLRGTMGPNRFGPDPLAAPR